VKRLVPIALVACAHELPAEQACLEVGYAIASRTEACTGDVDVAVARQEAFTAAYACDLPPLASPEQENHLYTCALTVRNLACELALEHGDDLDAWLASSPVCDRILDPT
jgi:hypothetical protein